MTLLIQAPSAERLADYFDQSQSATADNSGGGTGSGTPEPPEQIRVVVRTASGDSVALLDVPVPGLVVHRLAAGSVRLLTSDWPFAATLWRNNLGADGQSPAGMGAMHPLVIQPTSDG